MIQGKIRSAMVAAVAAVVLLALSACTTSTPPSPTSSAAETDVATQMPPKEAIAKIMAKGADLPVLGTSNGTLNGPANEPVKLVAELLQARATPDATLVVWRLKSATDQTVLTTSSQLAHPPLSDTRLLGVVDPKTKTTYRPYTYVPIEGNGQDNSCLCSDLPYQVDGSGELIYAVVPPLPASATSVSVTIPGFETFTGIKVERSKH